MCWKNILCRRLWIAKHTRDSDPRADFLSSVALAFCWPVPQASHRLHDRMLKRVIRAPVLFFDSNPVGRYRSKTFRGTCRTGRPSKRPASFDLSTPKPGSRLL